MSSDVLLGLPGKLKILLDRLTEARANLLDNLSRLGTDLATRASSTDMATMLGRLTQQRANNFDIIPNLPVIGPPKNITWADRLAKISSDIAQSTVRTSLSVPSGLETDLLDLAGPGVIYFLCFNHTTNVAPTFNVELTVDGVEMNSSPYVINGDVDEGLVIFGSIIRKVSDSSDMQDEVTFQPIGFKTRLLLRVTHDRGSNLTVYTYRKFMPLRPIS